MYGFNYYNKLYMVVVVDIVVVGIVFITTNKAAAEAVPVSTLRNEVYGSSS